MADGGNVQANLRWSQVVGGFFGCTLCGVYFKYGKTWQTLLCLFIIQGIYLLLSYRINIKFGKIPKSKLAFIFPGIFIIPTIVGFFRFPLELILVLWLSILVVIVSYRSFLGEAQVVLLFLMYHIITAENQLIYSIIGFLFFGSVLVLRLIGFSTEEEKKRT